MQTVAHPTVVLRHHLQIVPQQQIVVLVDTPPQRVFERQTGVVALVGRDRTVARVEVGEGDGDDVWAEEFTEGFFGVGAWFSLVGDSDWSLLVLVLLLVLGFWCCGC